MLKGSRRGTATGGPGGPTECAHSMDSFDSLAVSMFNCVLQCETKNENTRDKLKIDSNLRP